MNISDYKLAHFTSATEEATETKLEQFMFGRIIDIMRSVCSDKEALKNLTFETFTEMSDEYIAQTYNVELSESDCGSVFYALHEGTLIFEMVEPITVSAEHGTVRGFLVYREVEIEGEDD